MIHLRRQDLPSAAARYLDRVTQRIFETAQDQQREVAASAWRSKSSAQFREVRATLSAMCSGVERCMYCEDSAWTDVDHYVPKARSPRLAFTWTNYLAACSACNSNYKREEYPTGPQGDRLLIDPTKDEPLDHLVFSPITGRYEAVPDSEMAAESIRVFGLNREVLTTARRDAWHLLQLVILAYGRERDRGDVEQAERYQTIVGRQPFAGVLSALVAMAESDNVLDVTPECITAIRAHPEIRDWPEAIFAS